MTIPRPARVESNRARRPAWQTASGRERYGLHDVARGWEGMDGSVDELVQLGVVRDEPHAYPVWLWDKEGGTDPSCGDIDLRYNVLVDEVFHDDVGLGLVSKRYSARYHLLVRRGGLVHVDVHVSVGCVHWYWRKGIAQCCLLYTSPSPRDS